MNTDPIISIDFTDRGNLIAFKRHGWSRPESHGTWTDGTEASIEIDGLDPGRDYDCKILIGPFLAPPTVTHQTIVIKIAGSEMLRESISSIRAFDLSVPSIAIAKNGTIEVALWCSTAISPRSLGLSDDSRRLGVTFQRLTLSPVLREASSPPLERPLPADSTGSEKPDVVLPDDRGKLAAVTMVHNEPEYLPIWLRHYSRHVGLENCFVIDHGSDDGSTDGLSRCNVIRVPRATYDPVTQSVFNSKFCSSLLCWYKRVIYSDVDEILLPDPNVAASLREYCELPLSDVITSIGLNVQHVPDLESVLDPSRPVSTQRSWVFAASSMCKPLLTNRDIRWAAGSHSADAELIFNHLYMFHLRWFDLESGIRRLAKTRAMAWAAGSAGAHQRLTDHDWVRQFHSFASLPRAGLFDWDPLEPPISPFVDAVRASQTGREFSQYKIDLSIWGNQLWKLPDRFIGAF